VSRRPPPSDKLAEIAKLIEGLVGTVARVAKDVEVVGGDVRKVDEKVNTLQIGTISDLRTTLKIAETNVARLETSIRDVERGGQEAQRLMAEAQAEVDVLTSQVARLEKIVYGTVAAAIASLIAALYGLLGRGHG
jgi:hypothetical protein